MPRPRRAQAGRDFKPIQASAYGPARYLLSLSMLSHRGHAPLGPRRRFPLENPYDSGNENQRMNRQRVRGEIRQRKAAMHPPLGLGHMHRPHHHLGAHLPFGRRVPNHPSPFPRMGARGFGIRPGIFSPGRRPGYGFARPHYGHRPIVRFPYWPAASPVRPMGGYGMQYPRRPLGPAFRRRPSAFGAHPPAYDDDDWEHEIYDDYDGGYSGSSFFDDEDEEDFYASDEDEDDYDDDYGFDDDYDDMRFHQPHGHPHHSACGGWRDDNSFRW